MKNLLIALLLLCPAQALAVGECIWPGECSGAENGSFGQSFKINTTYALDPTDVNEGAIGLLWTDYRFYRVGVDGITRRFEGTEYTSTNAGPSGLDLFTSVLAYGNNPDAAAGVGDFTDEAGYFTDIAKYDWAGQLTGDVSAVSVLPASRIPNDTTLYGWSFEGIALKTDLTYKICDAAGCGFRFWMCQEENPSEDVTIFAMRPSSGPPTDFIKIASNGQVVYSQDDGAAGVEAAFTPAGSYVASGCETVDDYSHIAINVTAASGTDFYVNGLDVTTANTINALQWNGGVNNWVYWATLATGASQLLDGDIVQFIYTEDVSMLTELAVRQEFACGVYGDSDPSIRIAAYADGEFTEPIIGAALSASPVLTDELTAGDVIATWADASTGLGAVSVGDTIVVAGANQAAYNGTFVVHAAAAGSLSYTMKSAPTAVTATGTITVNTGGPLLCGDVK